MTDGEHGGTAERQGIGRRMSLLDRYLTAWIASAMVAGVQHAVHGGAGAHWRRPRPARAR